MLLHIAKKLVNYPLRLLLLIIMYSEYCFLARHRVNPFYIDEYEDPKVGGSADNGGTEVVDNNLAHHQPCQTFPRISNAIIIPPLIFSSGKLFL